MSASGGGRGSDASVRATYDAVAREYDQTLGGELDGKPLDRALLASFVEICGEGVIADVGCGPGHVTRFLASRHRSVLGIDLSPEMVVVAHESAPSLRFEVASMLELPVADAAWAGAILLYSIIHFTAEERAQVFREMRRVIRPDGWLLVSFHVSSDDFASGETNHLDSWFGKAVDIDGHFLAPEVVTDELRTAGFATMSTMLREPWPEVEYPSRRCYLLNQNRMR